MKMLKLARNRIYLLPLDYKDKTKELPSFAPVTGNRAQILYIAVYSSPKMSLPLDKINSNPYISACAHPRLSLALSKTICNSYIAAYSCAGTSLALNKIVEKSYTASCRPAWTGECLAYGRIISNSCTSCSKCTAAFHDDNGGGDIQRFTP